MSLPTFTSCLIQPYDLRMLILGHRGTILPDLSQNSLRAFQRAVTFADGFETDACLSKDGEIFLIHEAKYVSAATGVVYDAAHHLDAASVERLGRFRLDELSGNDLRQLRLKDGQPISTLHQAMALIGSHPGKVLNIELKAHGVVQPVLRQMQAAVAKGTIKAEAFLLSSFNHFALPVLRQQMPQITIGALFVAPDQPATRLYPWQPEDPASYIPLNEDGLQSAVLRQAQPELFIMPQDILSTDIVAMIRSHYPNAKVAAWGFTEKGGFDSAALVSRLRALPSDSVAAIIHDDPQSFAEIWRR